MRRDGYFGLLMAATVTGCIGFHGCERAGHASRISFIDREAAERLEDPQALVVRVDERGRLTLNRIETGTVGDPALLVEKLRTIFEDRRRVSVYENEVMVDMVGTIAYEDIEALIASLKPLQPSRITLVTTRNRMTQK